MVKTEFEIEVTGSGTIPRRHRTAFDIDRDMVACMLKRARNAFRTTNHMEGKAHVSLTCHGHHAYSIHTTRDEWWTNAKLVPVCVE